MWKYVANDFEVHRVNHLLCTYYVTKKMFSPRVNNCDLQSFTKHLRLTLVFM